MRLLILALAAGLVSLYFISKHRKLEFEVEMKMEPKDEVADGAAPAYEEEH